MFGKAWERERSEENMMQIMMLAAAVIRIAVLITIHTVEFTLFYTPKTMLLFTEPVLL
jgi:diacylglycerol kinase